MTARTATALAAAMLAVGVLVGAAGAVLMRGATTPDWALMADHMAGIQGMPMVAAPMMGPGASMPPADHGAHHPGIASPAP
ncbi:MAG TPA: hypothetical protein VFK54_10940 [Candidatus Limnocylindrales bacterium]|nr:hypothetical protein [Candidatus Limnocylindrales bacterium]